MKAYRVVFQTSEDITIEANNEEEARDYVIENGHYYIGSNPIEITYLEEEE